MKNFGNLEQPKNSWLSAFPELLDLVWTLHCMSLEYQLPWVAFWPEKWSNWDWIKKAMEQTFMHLNPEDKLILQNAYDRFLENIGLYEQEAILHSNIQEE